MAIGSGDLLGAGPGPLKSAMQMAVKLPEAEDWRLWAELRGGSGGWTVPVGELGVVQLGEGDTAPEERARGGGAGGLATQGGADWMHSLCTAR